jgi:uncharacterized membrane protein YczE
MALPVEALVLICISLLLAALAAAIYVFGGGAAGKKDGASVETEEVSPWQLCFRYHNIEATIVVGGFRRYQLCPLPSLSLLVSAKQCVEK